MPPNLRLHESIEDVRTSISSTVEAADKLLDDLEQLDLELIVLEDEQEPDPSDLEEDDDEAE